MFVVSMSFDNSALETYKAVHGDLLVLYKFVVPQDDVNYPPET